MAGEVDEDELTETAVDHIARLMDAVAASDPEAVQAALAGAPMMRVAVGLAYELHRVEVAHSVLGRQTAMLDHANAALFAERRELRDRVAQLRDLLDAHTAASTATAATRKVAA